MIGTDDVKLNVENADAATSFLTATFPELYQFPSTITKHEELHKFSVEQSELFWSVLARSRLQWFEDFKQVTSGKFTDENFNLKWFIGGKINISGIRC